jgi:hypothetical protein
LVQTVDELAVIIFKPKWIDLAVVAARR